MSKFKTFIYTIALLSSACTPDKKEEHIDHIILAINNLEKGIAQFKERTGIDPVFVGVHPDSFTRNALVALDGETYIEIMAPRPDAQNVPEDFTKMETLTPVGWAVRTRNIDHTKEKLKTAGFITTANRPGSRAKPDGSLLKWKTFRVEGQDEFPFFIQWSDSTIHPSLSSPSGCTFKSLQVTTHDRISWSQLNEHLELGIKIAEGKNPLIELTLATAKGPVVFSVAAPQKK
jgi:hypothetical protein